MNYLKVIRTEEKKISILLGGENNSLMQELTYQLSHHDNVRVINKTGLVKMDSSPINVSAVYYAIGFDSPSYSQTLLGTSVLQDYLHISQANNCPLFLVIGSKTPYLTKTSALMARQFSVIHRTKFDLIQCFETDPDIQIVESLIKKIIKSHKTTPKANVTKIVQAHRVAQSGRVRSTKKRWINNILVGIFLSSVLIMGVTVTGVLYFSDQLIKSISLREYNSTQSHITTINNLFYWNPLGLLLLNYLTTSPDIYETIVDLDQQIVNQSISDQKNLADLTTTTKTLESMLIDKERRQSLTRFEKNLKNNITETLSDLDKLSLLTSIFKPGESKNLLISFHDNQTITPHGGSFSGFAVINFDAQKIQQFSFFTPSEVESFLPGTLKSSPDYERVTTNSHMSLADLQFEPDSKLLADTIVPYIEKSLNRKIDYWMPVSLEIFDEVFCPRLVMLKTACLSPATLEFKTVLSSPDNIAKHLNNFPVSDKNIMLLKLMKHLSQRDSFIHSLSPSAAILDSLGWGSRVVSSSCPDDVVCQKQIIKSSFFTFERGVFLTAPQVNLEITIQPETSRVLSTLSIHVPKFSKPDAKLLYWFVVDPGINVHKVVVNGQDAVPVIKRTNLSADITRLGINVEAGQEKTSVISLEYSGQLVSTERFRYQLNNILSGLNDRNISVTFNYPPQWTTLSHQAPAVATPGKLSYNTTQSSFSLQIDLIPK